MNAPISYLTALVPTAALALVACVDPIVVPNAPAEPETARAKSNVRRVPVPYGTKLPCSGLIQEAVVSDHLGRDVAIEASDAVDSEATSLCWISEPVARAKRKRKRKRNKRQAQTSERVCHVTVYCSYIYDEQKERDKCSASDNTMSLALGAAGCQYNDPLKVDVLDADSQCRIVVHPADKETDAMTLSACASAVAMEISPARLRPENSQHARNQPAGSDGPG